MKERIHESVAHTVDFLSHLKPSKFNLVSEIYSFSIISKIGGSLYSLYYSIFLYRNSFSLSILAYDGLIAGVSGWFGYLIGTKLLQKKGFASTVRLSFMLSALVALTTFIFADSVTENYQIFSVLRGIPGGMYLAGVQLALLRSIDNKSRNTFFHWQFIMEFSISVLLPVALGALIIYLGGYKTAFFLSAVVYFIASLVPYPRQEFGKIDLNIRETLTIFKKPYFKQISVNELITAGFDQFNGFAIAIVPFLILNNELNVGLLISGVSVVAAIISYLTRRMEIRSQNKWAIVGHLGRLLGNTFFIFFWTVPGLVVWRMSNKLFVPLNDPANQELVMENNQMVLGNRMQEEAAEINIISITLGTIGHVAAYGVLGLLLTAMENEQILPFQLLIFGFGLWKLIGLLWKIALNKKLINQ